MLVVNRKVIQLGIPLKTQRKRKRIILKSVSPLATPIAFSSIYTRDENVKNWEDFFNCVRKEFIEKFGKIEQDTIEEYQFDKINMMIVWLRHLVAMNKYDRGNARAIEELLTNVTWYEIAGEEKFKDRFRKITGRKMSEKNRLLFKEMQQILIEQKRRGEDKNLTQASRDMKRRHRWTERERINFYENYRISPFQG